MLLIFQTHVSILSHLLSCQRLKNFYQEMKLIKKKSLTSTMVIYIDCDLLLLQRNMFLQILRQENKPQDNIAAVIDYFQTEPHLKILLPALLKFLKVFVIIPVTSATAERAFSGLQKIKNITALNNGTAAIEFNFIAAFS